MKETTTEAVRRTLITAIVQEDVHFLYRNRFHSTHGIAAYLGTSQYTVWEVLRELINEKLVYQIGRHYYVNRNVERKVLMSALSIQFVEPTKATSEICKWCPEMATRKGVESNGSESTCCDKHSAHGTYWGTWPIETGE